MIARRLSRALLAIGFGAIAVGAIVVALGLYLASWPLRRAAAKGSLAAARMGALQDLLAAIAQAIAIARHDG